MKDTKSFLNKKKTKDAIILLSVTEIFLKKKKKRSVNLVVSDIKIFSWMSVEGNFLEFKK